MRHLNVYLAQPRGFCAGVERAIAIVEKALERYGAPIYVRHKIVHNEYVVGELTKKGVIFVKEIDEIPEGARAIFSAHGVAEKVEHEAVRKQLNVFDATCPLVTKVHNEAKRHEREQRQIILIGHAGHPEVAGTSGRVQQQVILVQSREDVATIHVEDPEKLAYVTQTTLSVDDTKEIIEALKQRFPAIIGPDLKDICYATQNRQNAVRELAKKVELVLVIGATFSSNSKRLKDVAINEGVAAYLISSEKEIDHAWFDSVDSVGISAGASAPEVLVDNVIAYLAEQFDTTLKTLDGPKENVHFRLPKELREKIAV